MNWKIDDPRFEKGELFEIYGSYKHEDESRCHFGWYHDWCEWRAFEMHPQVRFRGCRKCSLVQEEP